MFLRVRFGGIGYVSDRTARETIRMVSRLVRRAQELEIEYVISRQELDLAARQSIEARVVRDFTQAPVLEIEHARQGSWIVGAVVGAAALYLFRITLGRTISEGWRKNQIHKDLVKYIGNLRPKMFEGFLNKAKHELAFDGQWEVRKVRLLRRGPDTLFEIDIGPTGEKKATPFTKRIDGDSELDALIELTGEPDPRPKSKRKKKSKKD